MISPHDARPISYAKEQAVRLRRDRDTFEFHNAVRNQA